TFDDGTGTALFVGGSFSTAGGIPAQAIAKWDGSTWAPVGSGMNTGATVDELVVLDAGSGAALHAGGHFTAAGGVAANCIATWNGTNWSALGSGVLGDSGSTVYAM